MELLAPLVSLLTKTVHDQKDYPNSQFDVSVFDLGLLICDPICPRRIRSHVLKATK